MSNKLCFNVRQATYDRFLQSSSPGPIYAVPSSIGTSPTKPTSPKFTFGGGRRSSTPVPRSASPPVVQYDMSSTLGRQSVSTRRTAATVKFGTSKRPPLSEADAAVPGPGAHDVPSQAFTSARPYSAQSRMRTAPAFTIAGRSSSPERPGTALARPPPPGPGDYGVHSSFGQQQLSRLRSAPRARIGTAARDPPIKPRDTSPAPGAYAVPGAFGSQALSRNRSAPVIGMGGGPPRVPPAVLTAKAVPNPPLYRPPDTIGVAPPLSRLHKGPTFKFGTSQRPALHASESSGSMYLPPSAFGAQAVSSRRTHPSVTFGTSQRAGLHTAATAVPAASPIAVESRAALSAIGPQSLSTRRTGPAYTLGAR